MWPIILNFVALIVPVIPSLVTDIENLWRHKPNSGAQKWISVEQALSGSISEVAQQIAAVAPPGTKVEDISAAVVIFSKAINDATVALANALHVFPHAGQPAIAAVAPTPVKP